jgi:hypothetical protein
MDEAWQLVRSNYSINAFHSAVPSWQLKFRCVVFVLQGFYRNTILDNGAGMLSANYDRSNFLKLICVPWMWQILHTFLFIPYCYNASTTYVNKGHTNDQVWLKCTDHIMPALLVFYPTVLQLWIKPATHCKYAPPNSKIIIKNCILLIRVHICISHDSQNKEILFTCTTLTNFVCIMGNVSVYCDEGTWVSNICYTKFVLWKFKENRI